jgi:hypothetical protein
MALLLVITYYPWLSASIGSNLVDKPAETPFKKTSRLEWPELNRIRPYLRTISFCRPFLHGLDPKLTVDKFSEWQQVHE